VPMENIRFGDPEEAQWSVDVMNTRWPDRHHWLEGRNSEWPRGIAGGKFDCELGIDDCGLEEGVSSGASSMAEEGANHAA